MDYSHHISDPGIRRMREQEVARVNRLMAEEVAASFKWLGGKGLALLNRCAGGLRVLFSWNPGRR